MVIVMGAGSSQAYGLPSSLQLNDEIENILSSVLVSKQNQDEHINQLAYIVEQIYKTPKDKVDLEKFYYLFTHDYFHTIDEFLLGKPQKIMTIGKILIAIVIHYSENKSKLINRHNIEGWYGSFWKQIKEHLIYQNYNWLREVIFITFNYDRSFEEFITHNAASIIGEPKKILEHFRIHHVYGMAGNYIHIKDFNEVLIDYGMDLYNSKEQVRKNVEIASRYIVHPKEFEDLKGFTNQVDYGKLLEHEETYYFLGCGYHQQNLDAINIKQDTKIFGTAKGLEAYKLDRIKRSYHSINLKPHDCVKFYNEIIADDLKKLLEKTKK